MNESNPIKIDKVIDNFHKSIATQLKKHMKVNKITIYMLSKLTGLGQTNLKVLLKGTECIKTTTLVKILVALNLKLTMDATQKSGSILLVQIEN